LNTANLHRQVPAGEDWTQLAAGEKKSHAQAFIHGVLGLIEAEGREPDAWEAHDVLLAIGLIAGGMYSASLAYADRACTLPDERSPLAVLALNSPSLQDLHQALDGVSSLQPIKAG
jgi:hypothetical protein